MTKQIYAIMDIIIFMGYILYEDKGITRKLFRNNTFYKREKGNVRSIDITNELDFPDPVYREP